MTCSWPSRFVQFLLSLVLVTLPASGLGAESAPAQFSDSAGECPEGNLLVGARALDPGLPVEQLAKLGDGVVAPDGSPWPDSSVLVALRRPIELDLGKVIKVSQFFLQVDADQAFDFDLSSDRVTWTRVPVEAHPTASGMILRSFDVSGLLARYVRLSAREPSDVLAVSELRLFCRHQAKLRRSFEVVGVRPVQASSALSSAGLYWVKGGIAALTMVWIVLGWLSKRRGVDVTSHWRRRVRDGVLIALACSAAAAYFEFGAYHRPGFVHHHDVFHYFIGAKYFPELGYDGLYQCTAVAEAQAGFPQRVRLRAQRDLKTNRLVSGVEVLQHQSDCLDRFAPARWQEFSHDVAYFANSRSVEDWHRVLKDEGFNASPTWILFGAAVARRLQANDAAIGRGSSMMQGFVGPLDPLLLVVACAALTWAFGWRTASLGVIVFAANPLSEFSWIGGGFLRELWLVALIVGICLLRRRLWVLAGVLLALSGLLQLFPIACLGAIALASAVEWWRRRRLDPQALRIVLAALASAVLLVPLSALGAGRRHAWSEFAANTEKHAATPSGNFVGLRTVLSFRPSTRIGLLFDQNAVDPFAPARAARLENFQAVWPLYWIGLGLGLWAFLRCFRERRPWWWTAALGLVFVPLALETSGYYVAWLAALALLGHGHRECYLPILIVIIGSLGIDLAGLELDVQYAWISVLLVLGTCGVLVLASRTRRDPAADLG